MEDIENEILSEMMIENLNVPNEFFPLPPLYSEVEDALWEDPVQVNKIIYVWKRKYKEYQISKNGKWA